MKILDQSQARKWCGTRSINVDEQGFLNFPKQQFSFGFDPPTSAAGFCGLSNLFVHMEPDTKFRGALLWFREWGVWSDYSEKVGWETIALMRKASGHLGDPRNMPAQHFAAKEALMCQSFLMPPLLSGWDAFLVPDSGSHFVFISHHTECEVVSRTKAIDKKLFKECSGAHRRWTY